MKNILFYLVLFVSSLSSFNTVAEQETQTFSDAELAQMLAPIALYPDSLLTHILIASTYPIEIVEAHRWLKKNDHLNNKQKKQLLNDFQWDASVKALVPFERVLSRLSEDLSWTQTLGDAFLQDESRLLISIQALRKQAKKAGNLNKMDNVDIDYQDNNISIVSREKEVVYVPYYDSRVVYGSWYWSAYPPVYWHPHHSVYVSHYRPFYWHSGVHITFNYFFSAFHWHKRHVVVVSPHRTHHRYYHQRPRRLVANGGYAKRWSHQPAHRKGVAYRTKRTSEKYYGKRVGSHRATKQSTVRHHQVKQKLHTSHYARNKSAHKSKYKSEHKIKNKVNNKLAHNRVKPNKVKSSQAPKYSNAKHNKGNTVSRTHKQNRKMNTQEKKQKASKRGKSLSKNKSQQVAKISRHKGAGHRSDFNKRHNAHRSKERK